METSIKECDGNTESYCKDICPYRNKIFTSFNAQTYRCKYYKEPTISELLEDVKKGEA